MTEVYTFADTPEGRTQARTLEGSLLQGKFAVAYETAVEGTTPLLFLLATPAPRPNRAERGCDLNCRPDGKVLAPPAKLFNTIWNLNL